jgi:hypothetical protein
MFCIVQCVRYGYTSNMSVGGIRILIGSKEKVGSVSAPTSKRFRSTTLPKTVESIQADPARSTLFFEDCIWGGLTLLVFAR